MSTDSSLWSVIIMGVMNVDLSLVFNVEDTNMWSGEDHDVVSCLVWYVAWGLRCVYASISPNCSSAFDISECCLMCCGLLVWLLQRALLYDILISPASITWCPFACCCAAVCSVSFHCTSANGSDWGFTLP